MDTFMRESLCAPSDMVNYISKEEQDKPTIVDQSSFQAFLLQHRKRVQGLALRQKVRALNILRTSQEIVELRTAPEVR